MKDIFTPILSGIMSPILGYEGGEEENYLELCPGQNAELSYGYSVPDNYGTLDPDTLPWDSSIEILNLRYYPGGTTTSERLWLGISEVSGDVSEISIEFIGSGIDPIILVHSSSHKTFSSDLFDGHEGIDFFKGLIAVGGCTPVKITIHKNEAHFFKPNFSANWS